jgi:hypothetical protein
VTSISYHEKGVPYQILCGIISSYNKSSKFIILIKTNLVTGMNISMSSGTFLIILNAHKAAFFLHKNIVKNIAEKTNNSSAKQLLLYVDSFSYKEKF